MARSSRSSLLLVLMITISLPLAGVGQATKKTGTFARGEESYDDMPPWVQPSHRQMLGLTVGGTPVHSVVASDGSGNYTTVSAAVAAAPARSQGKGGKKYVIYIKKGIYYENVVVSKNNIMLLGDGMGQTIISGNRSNGTGYPTDATATVRVNGERFLARDLTIENTAGPENYQAVALLSISKKSVIYRCELKGFQDTLSAHKGLQFYRDCHISGTVDFVFGNAKAVFQNCLLLVRRPVDRRDNVVTAQGRDGPGHPSGFSFQNCSVTTLENLAGVRTYLGRPWKKHSHVVFMQSFLDGIVHPDGWMDWKKDNVVVQTTDTVFYGEYNNTGPGASLGQRVKWSGFHVMDVAQAAQYTVDQFIQGNGKWLPYTGVEYKPGL